MVFNRCYLFPIAFCLLMPVTFIITYAIAVTNGNIVPVFPYISDTGTWSPESCIFGLILAFGALLLGIVVYVRYRQVRELCEKNEFIKPIKKVNAFSLFTGFIASIGIVVVGSFQETNVFSVHVLGAVMAFGMGSVYHVFQLLISLWIYPTFGKKNIIVIRAICTSFYFVAMFVSFIFSVLSLLQFKGNDITKWTEADGGYQFHLIGTITEWLMVGFNQVLILLFTWEFKQIQCSEPTITTIS